MVEQGEKKSSDFDQKITGKKEKDLLGVILEQTVIVHFTDNIA